MIRPLRIAHTNVNCSDLDRSMAFYRDVIGLQAHTRTTPESPQAGAAFGLDLVQWDAWMMGGDTGFDAPMLDLLEWQVPRPAGTPPADPTTPGFARVRFSSDADVDVDPDGTRLDIVAGDVARLAGVVVNCTDLARSRHHYADVCGLADDGDVLRDPATGFEVHLVETSVAPVAPRSANQLGIFRMAWLTDDVDRDHAELLAAGVKPMAPPATLAMGSGLPTVRALFWRDPDGACLELIESH